MALTLEEEDQIRWEGIRHMNLIAHIYRFFLLEESIGVFEKKTAEKLRTGSCALLWKRGWLVQRVIENGKGDRKEDGVYRLGVTVTWT